MDKRPDLNRNISVQDFKDFYWLKEELVAFCRAEGLAKSGSKIELANRIVHYIQTGKPLQNTSKPLKIQSNIDWTTANLTLDTQITDSYKNSENVRAFFQKHIGKSFKFNVVFMNWMKANHGKTLAQAIDAWQDIKAQKKTTKHKNIAPQFEYNRYIRDFMAANPNKDRNLAIQCWKLKKARRGDNIYHTSDLDYL